LFSAIRASSWLIEKARASNLIKALFWFSQQSFAVQALKSKKA